MSSSGRSKRILDELAAVAGDEFEIIREVGRGGMGWVFLASDRRLHRRVALKVLSPALLMEEGMGDRFLREAQILASLRHAHIVGVHAVHHAGDVNYFVMDFIDGPSLDQVLRARERLDISAVRTIAYMVGSALDYGHHRGRGVIHRDIKPANVILDSEGSVVVTDFGISKVLTGNTRLTRTGVVIGTPEFMSPEQCAGDDIGTASDQYSLGALLYQMVTGRPPFSGGTVEVLVGHVQGTPAPVRERRPDCPPELAAAIERMLLKSPGERFANVAAALEAMGATPVGLRSERRAELSALARSSLTGTSSIDISSPLSPVRARTPDASADSGSGPVEPITLSPTSSGDTVSTLYLGSPTARMLSGDSIPIWVDARDADGRTVPEAPIELRVDHPELAMLDEGGLLVGLRAGTVTVTATTGEIERHVQVEIVDPPRPARIALDPPEIDLVVGESIPVSVEVSDQWGKPLVAEVAWDIDEPGVVRVDGRTVIALGEGTARVTATAGLASASVTVATRRRPVALVLGDTRESVELTETFVVTPLVVDVDGVPIEGLTVTWKSSDPAVADVDGAGRVAPQSPGTTTITARHDSVTGSFEMEVCAPAPPPPPPPVPSEPVEPEIAVGLALATSDLFSGPPARLSSVPPADSRPESAAEAGPESRSMVEPSPRRGVLQTRRRKSEVAIAGSKWPAGRWLGGAAAVAAVALGGWFVATRDGGDVGPAAVSTDGAITTEEVVTPPDGASALDPAAISGGGSSEGGAATVVPPPPPRFTILPIRSLNVGESAQARSDLPAEWSGQAEWASADLAIATVSAGGVVQAVAPGATELLLRLVGREVSVPIVVTAAPPAESPPAESAPASPPEREVPPRTTDPPPATDPAPRAAARAAAVLPPAEVRIRVRPEAVTYVDGAARPDSLRSTNILELPPGEYQIRLSRPGFLPFDTLVVLASEQVLVIRKNLQPSGDR
jgi:serine/threonine protein kinase